MSKSFALAITSAAAVVLAAPAAQAATTLTLGPSALCSASGCFGETTKTFTKAFSASGGTIDVSALKLFRGIVGDMQDYAVKISFELADGSKVGTWGSFTLSALAGEFVTIGGQAITWDAAMGDLILKLDLVMPEKGGSFGGFASGGGGGFSGASALPFPIVGRPIVQLPADDIVSLIRSSAPEPTTWALLITGFGMAGGALRRRTPRTANQGYS